MSLFMIKSFIFAKSYMQYCNARLLSSDLRPCQGSEGQQLRIIALPTNDQLEACSCARIVTSGNSHVSPTFTLVQLILLRAAARSNNCSSFQTPKILELAPNKRPPSKNLPPIGRNSLSPIL